VDFVSPARNAESWQWLEQDHPEWARRRRVAAETFIPWLSTVRPLEDATILEFGCGQGAVSSAFAEVAGRHIGYDIDADAVNYARKKLCLRGLDAELHAAPPDVIFDALGGHRGELDVLLLYAVLEHMTVSERLALLELAPSLLRPGGVIAVIELPNRLVTGDHHTSQIPFFSQLPEELALRYWRSSERADFTEAMRRASESEDLSEAETLTRWGRGGSFHEFELVFGDLQQHIVASSYDLPLLRERAVMSEELALARTLERVRPDLAPCFSRYWLDFVLNPEPVSPATVSFVWPWMMETQLPSASRWTPWDTIELMAHEPLELRLPTYTTRLVVAALFDGEEAGVSAIASGTETNATLRGPSGGVAYAELNLTEASAEVDLLMTRSGYISFVGYEAGADRPPVA
jgi:SAM-dependent methyltransferase